MWNANANSYGDIDSHNYGNSYSDSYSDSYGNLYADTNTAGESNADSHSCGYCHRHANCHGDSYSHSDANGRCHSYGNANGLCFNVRLLAEPWVVRSNHTARMPGIYSGPRDRHHSEFHQQRQDLFTCRTADRRKA